MTMFEDVSGMNRTSHRGPRLGMFLFAALFGIQCVWLLAVELIRPDINQLPTDMTTAATAAMKRWSFTIAASIGAVRGDLWAQSAYTYANLLHLENVQAKAGASTGLQYARKDLDRALRWAPHQSGAWLLLAGLAQEFHLTGITPIETLKMSYYTGPSELPLVPLRLRVAVQADNFDDIEIREFIGRDLRLLLAQNRKSAITEAYRSASPAGQHFMEQAMKDIDPSALTLLRAAARDGPFAD
jgi:hypothetical protein